MHNAQTSKALIKNRHSQLTGAGEACFEMSGASTAAVVSYGPPRTDICSMISQAPQESSSTPNSCASVQPRRDEV